MARLSAAQVAVWDWERFATGLPVGVDALHYLLQVLLQKHGVGDQVAQQFLAQSKDVVSRAGANTETAAVTTAAYLAEIAGRYLSLAEGPDGELLARRAHWTHGRSLRTHSRWRDWPTLSTPPGTGPRASSKPWW